MDFLRLKCEAEPISAAAYVRTYSDRLAPVAYKVSRLPEDERPHCVSCDSFVHLFDIKNLKAGIMRPPGKKTRANPGAVHYEAVAECPYSYANDPRFADYVADREFDKEDRAFNEQVLIKDAKVRSGIDAIVAWFMYPYSGNVKLSDTDKSMLNKLEKTFILPMKGIGSASWLAVFELMLLLPDREREFKSGRTAKLGFRASFETQKILLRDSKGNEHERTIPRYVTLGYVPKRKNKRRSNREIKPMEWMGESLRVEVSRESAIALWKKGKALVNRTHQPAPVVASQAKAKPDNAQLNLGLF